MNAETEVRNRLDVIVYFSSFKFGLKCFEYTNQNRAYFGLGKVVNVNKSRSTELVYLKMPPINHNEPQFRTVAGSTLVYPLYGIYIELLEELANEES